MTPGIAARAPARRRRCEGGTPRGSRPSWSCRRRSGPGGRTPRRDRRAGRCRRRPRRRRRTSSGRRTSMTRSVTSSGYFVDEEPSRDQPCPARLSTRLTNRLALAPSTGVANEQVNDVLLPPATSPLMCGDTITVGIVHSGLSSGSGSVDEDVQGRAGDRARRQGVDQRLLVDRGTSAHVEEARRRLHGVERPRRSKTARVAGVRATHRGRSPPRRSPRRAGRSRRSRPNMSSARVARPTIVTSMPRASARSPVPRPMGPGPTTTSRVPARRSVVRPRGQSTALLVEEATMQARRERQHRADRPLRDPLVEDPAGVRDDDVGLDQPREQQHVDPRRGGLDPPQIDGRLPHLGELARREPPDEERLAHRATPHGPTRCRRRTAAR